MEQELSHRELYVLSALADKPLHGYGLVKAIERKSAGSIVFDPTHLYRVLRKASKEGWVHEQPAAEGSRRRTYRLTSKGRRVLRDQLAGLVLLAERLQPAAERGR